MQLLPKKLPDEIGLIGHTIIDYPNPGAARAIIETLISNHASLIELQIPFSEPIADGPVFAKANHEAIARGITLQDCYKFMEEMTSRYSIPFVFMTYANIALKQGYEEFVERAKESGASGAIIADLPLDLASDYLAVCKQQQFAAISVVSPNISDARLATLSPLFDGFIYAVARAGVTGTQTHFDQSISNYLDRIREYSDLPVAVGFGVSSADNLAFLKGKADYAVIGTHTLRLFEQQGVEGVAKFWQELAAAIK